MSFGSKIASALGFGKKPDASEPAPTEEATGDVLTPAQARATRTSIAMDIAREIFGPEATIVTVVSTSPTIAITEPVGGKTISRTVTFASGWSAQQVRETLEAVRAESFTPPVS